MFNVLLIEGALEPTVKIVVIEIDATKPIIDKINEVLANIFLDKYKNPNTNTAINNNDKAMIAINPKYSVLNQPTNPFELKIYTKTKNKINDDTSDMIEINNFFLSINLFFHYCCFYFINNFNLGNINLSHI